MAAECVVCEKNGKPSNRLVKCSKCKIFVHELCYGIKWRDFKENYMCDPCKAGVITRKCVLCPDEGVSAFKKTGNKKWVHVICALYVREATFKCNVKMSPVLIGGIKKKRYKEECFFCDKREGVVIQCLNNCEKKFHVSCGKKFGVLKEDKSHANYYVAFCDVHVSVKYMFSKAISS